MELACSEPLIVLIDGRHLIVRNDLFKQLAIDVVALQGLSRLTPTEDIATVCKPLVNQTNTWRVLPVAKCEAHLDLLGRCHKHLHKKVHVGLIEWQEDHFVVLADEVLNHLDGLRVDEET